MARKRRRLPARRRLGTASVSKWKKKYETVQSRSARVRDKAGESVNTIVRSGTVLGSSYATGMTQTYWGQVDLFGVPAELLATAGLHVAAFMSGRKGTATNLRNVADGIGAAWMAQAGQAMGEKLRSEGGSDSLEGAAFSVMGPRTGYEGVEGEGLTADDLEALA